MTFSVFKLSDSPTNETVGSIRIWSKLTNQNGFENRPERTLEHRSAKTVAGLSKTNWYADGSLVVIIRISAPGVSRTPRNISTCSNGDSPKSSSFKIAPSVVTAGDSSVGVFVSLDGFFKKSFSALVFSGLIFTSPAFDFSFR